MTLAYVFWHWPQPGIARDEYEQRLRDFHGALELPGSRTFRLEHAPFPGPPGGSYEDWYPVDGWAALGELNERAVSGARRPPHDAAATRAADGHGGVYGLVQGDPAAPAAYAQWLSKPRDTSYERFHAELASSVPDATIWQRQMVLGPAPEYVVLAGRRLALPWASTATRPTPI
jgi:hypothetical protein